MSGRLWEAFLIKLEWNLNLILASWATKLTWNFTKIKMKTYNWNSSVALLSPTCFIIIELIFISKDVFICGPLNFGNPIPF